METVEVIKTEYMLFNMESEPKTLKEAKSLLTIYIDDMDDALCGVMASTRRNIFDALVAKIKNLFCNFLGYQEEDVDYYRKDTVVLDRHGVLACRYNQIFSLIRDNLDEDNFVAMCGLAEFAHNTYLEDYYYFESLRDQLNLSNRGIDYSCGKEEKQEAFQEFFEEEFQNLTGKKMVKEYKNKG